MERKFGFLRFRGRIKHNFLRIHFDVLGRHLLLFCVTNLVGLRDEKNTPHHSENIIFFFEQPGKRTDIDLLYFYYI